MLDLQSYKTGSFLYHMLFLDDIYFAKAKQSKV